MFSPAQEQDTPQPYTTEDLLQELNQDAQQLTKDGSNRSFWKGEINNQTGVFPKDFVHEHNIKRHYETKHKNKYDGILGSSRTEKIAKLRQEIGGLTRIFSKKRQENEAAVSASYRVAHILSREVKPFSDGECVKKCLLAVVEELCPEKKNAFEAVSLSRTTIARRVEDMGKHLQSKLRDKAARFEMFSIAADESTDSSDTAQLLVFIRGTNSDFKLTEELAAMRGMHGNTIGEDLFKEVSAVIEGLALPWEKLVGVTTDGARSMVGCHSGLASRLLEKSSSLMEPSLCGFIALFTNKISVARC
ncbi:hypothetical protein C0Q70_12960 [Pomacea canaliculata]|uniref:Uncharacterized protein n=1 Tax=Pomacea canaliculata TaxID=400727 RepID=A0A2T7P2Y2_POMCA|nr:hypothetical protein C0Q70_12960 [Pomacea canaliculata]